MPCRFAGALCLYLCLVCQPGWVNSMGPARCVHTCCRSPRNSSPKIGFDRALPRSRGSQTGTQTRDIERAKPKPREGVRVSVLCRGPLAALSLPSASSFAHGTHNTRTNPPTRIARLGRAGGAGCFPNLLSEHGLANTSSNESHHHDHDHATMSLFCLYLTISSQSSTLPTSRFLVSSSPKVPGLRLAWPGRLHRLSAQLDVLWLSQVRPMSVGGCVVRACVWPASLFHLESAGPWIHHLCTQSSFRAINAAARMQHDRRNFLCHLSIPCTHACNPVRALPLELGPNPRSRTRKRRCWTLSNRTTRTLPTSQSLHRGRGGKAQDWPGASPSVTAFRVGGT